ncbi:phosphocarrier protein [Seinonella peptonophila]|uniref:Phosphocarrier protein HPr n=1 Tax=Seinonella peptonophila TaxID=112248 RepID=A0A1M4Z5I4_9BACL|nr:HPr family phosphocarrier protein [Seinonella peptonophila]SHF12856.1 phosphocarrier protein [Seinonella peptonophila]
MAEKQVTVTNPSGLHARPAAVFIQTASRFESSIKIEKNGKEVDAKSLLGVMSLAVKPNETITIRAEGEDAETAVEQLCQLVESYTE